MPLSSGGITEARGEGSAGLVHYGPQNGGITLEDFGGGFHDNLLRSGFGKVLGGNPYFPEYGVVAASVLNTQPALDVVQKTLAAEDLPIPVPYGHCQLGGKVYALDYTSGTWTIGYLLGYGEIDSFDRVLLNAAAPVDGVTINYYTGTTSQGVDPLLAAAIDGYADDLVVHDPAGDIGLVHVVIQYTDTHYDDWPRVVVEVYGKKVWNPKTGTIIYSANPALQMADLISNPIYGKGEAVDDTTLEALQDINDDATIGEVRRQSYLTIDRRNTTDAWVEIFRAYASCWITRREGVVYFIPDRPASSVKAFAATDIVNGSLRIRKKDSSDIPTVIRAIYTDKTGDVWRERPCEAAEAVGVSTGSVQRRESRIRLPGIDRHSQAFRECKERLNKLTLSDLVVEWTGYDECHTLEMGDVVDVTHPFGLTAKLLRLTAEPRLIRAGRWALQGEEYDPAAYSDEIASEPTYADGSLPNGGVPGPVTALAVGETTYQLQNGKYASRLDISWVPPLDSFATSFEIMVKDAMTVVWAGSTSGSMMSTSPLQELVDYTVEVVAKNALYSSAAAFENYNIVGKSAKPSAPPSIAGFEAGGEVRLSWEKALDPDAERYEVRYSDTAGSWATSVLIDVVDSLRLNTKDVPPSATNPGGVWRFYVRTIDSIEQQSDDEITIDLAVTLDTNAFKAGGLEPISGHASLTFMHSVEEIRGSGVTEYYSDGNDTFTSLFGGAAMSTYGNALASYQSAQGTSEWFSEELDLGEDRSGSFQAGKSYVDHAGTAVVELGLKADGGSYVWGAMSRQGSARYAQVRIRSAGIFQTSVPEGYIRADVVATREDGSDTSLASGGKTITLEKEYSAARSIIITPQGTAARPYSIDNIILDNSGFTTFDVYIFNSAGAQVASDFLWAWKGI